MHTKFESYNKSIIAFLLGRTIQGYILFSGYVLSLQSGQYCHPRTEYSPVCMDRIYFKANYAMTNAWEFPTVFGKPTLYLSLPQPACNYLCMIHHLCSASKDKWSMASRLDPQDPVLVWPLPNNFSDMAAALIELQTTARKE